MLEVLEQDQPTLLIVDDERVNRTMLAELLGQQYRVLLAKDGHSALTIASREARVASPLPWCSGTMMIWNSARRWT